MKKFNITGMSCAACSARIEKAVGQLDGVTQCSVNLLTNSMIVDGSADEKTVIDAVVGAGYGASVSGKKKDSEGVPSEMDNSGELAKVRTRLIASLIPLAILMYFSMGHMMFGFPIPSFFVGNHVAMGLVQLILSAVIMVINQKFFISGTKAVINKSPNMDTLVAMGSSAAFLYSLYALFMMTDAQLSGDMQAVGMWMDEFYFESAATILTLITVGKMLETRSKGKTTDAIRGLMKLAPQTALVERNGDMTEIPADELSVGDIFVVRDGMSFPADGVIIDGKCSVDESALTGESIPVDKETGDKVSAATINRSGFVRCETTGVGEDTVLSGIIRAVTDAAATKAPVQKIADRVSAVFVPSVIAIALLTTIVWLIIGRDVGFCIARGITVLVISCPCALGLATPVAIMVGSGKGAVNGILFKNAQTLEETGGISIVALDKTGTLTTGKPSVTDVASFGVSDTEMLRYAYSLEKMSSHPLAYAVCEKCESMGITASEVMNFRSETGSGLYGEIDSHTVRIGNERYVGRYIGDTDTSVRDKSEALASEGKTPVFVVCDEKCIGMIAIADTVRDDSREAVDRLHKMGIKVVMLTGDNKKTAEAVAGAVGVDEVFAEVLPNDKDRIVRNLRKKGKVAMVGDGINDAPALTSSDIGIAIGAGTDIALDAADIVLMKSSLCDVSAAVQLSRCVLRNVHQNLFWAFFYNVLCIPLAAGVYSGIGLTLNPMFGAAAMSLSSFCVVCNALRLNFIRLYDPSTYRKMKHKTKKKEARIMEKTMVIEGMMCGHCEATVKKTLEAIDGVSAADVSHEKGTAVVTMENEVSDDVLRKAVEDKDYKVTSIN